MDSTSTSSTSNQTCPCAVSQRRWRPTDGPTTPRKSLIEKVVFFLTNKDEAENQSTVKIYVPHQSTQSEPLTEPHRRTGHPARHPVSVTLSTTRPWQLKHRGCHCPGHRTSQDGAPLRRQACSARLHIKLVSPRALARAN